MSTALPAGVFVTRSPCDELEQSIAFETCEQHFFGVVSLLFVSQGLDKTLRHMLRSHMIPWYMLPSRMDSGSMPEPVRDN
jgi:hypothetical protein